MKRLLTLVLVITVAISLAGCDALQRKFTRKSKVVKKPRIYQLKKYDVKPSPELYEKHFVYWETWSSEILQRLGDNHKKDVSCIEQLLGQLNDMQNILVSEKAGELEKHIRSYEQVRDTIVTEELSQYNKSWVRTTLDREDRYIKRDFAIDRIKNYIKKDWEQGDAAYQPSAAAPAQAQAAPQAQE